MYLFFRWVAYLANISEEGVIAIDGKSLRRSINITSKKAAIYIVSAWAKEHNLILSQVKVDPDILLNLIKSVKTSKVGVMIKQLKAESKNDYSIYLLDVI